MVELLEEARVGEQIGKGRVPENHQGGLSSARQVKGECRFSASLH